MRKFMKARHAMVKNSSFHIFFNFHMGKCAQSPKSWKNYFNGNLWDVFTLSGWSQKIYHRMHIMEAWKRLRNGWGNLMDNEHRWWWDNEIKFWIFVLCSQIFSNFFNFFSESLEGNILEKIYSKEFFFGEIQSVNIFKIKNLFYNVILKFKNSNFSWSLNHNIENCWNFSDFYTEKVSVKKEEEKLN